MPIDTRDTLRLCTAGSVDDGKSTFVGRLLHDTKNVLADTLAAVEHTSAARGFSGLDFSLLVDGLRAEREQGITIDVAYRYFATDQRTFILADTPGHVQYTRNTVTGMSTLQVVVLLIDARHGTVEQTRRHLQIAGLLGARSVILAVNKIDLVDYREEVYREIESEFLELCGELGIDDPHAVPISALVGDNVAEPSTRMDWYTGPTVLGLLETIPVNSGRALDLPARFPIQYVIRENASDYRGYAGRITTGTLEVGEELHTSSGLSALITHIDTADGPRDTACAGDSVVLRLDKEIDLVRGDLLAAESFPEQTREFPAMLVGLAESGVRPGKQLELRYGTASWRARVKAEDNVGQNDVAKVHVEVASAVPVESYAARGALGSFLLVDKASGDTLAAGLVG